MLAFGALIDLSLAPLDSEDADRLSRSLLTIPGQARRHAVAECAVVEVADHRSLPFDADLPYVDDELLVAGVLRIDARSRLCAALAPSAPGALDGASDARLVALAFRRWDDRLAEHLIGDYAFVVWHRTSGRLTAARDPLGNRQLYWARVGTRMALGSSVDLVRCLPGLSNELDSSSIASVLRDGWIERADGTVLRGVHRVPAAHTLLATRDAPARLRRHWDFPVPTPLRFAREDDYVERCNEVLGDVVGDRLRGESATIMLSGGMDSSTLAATARRVAPACTLHAQTTMQPTLAPSDDDRLSTEIARQLGIEQTVLGLETLPALSHLGAPDDLPAQPLDEPDLADLREGAAAAARQSPVVLFGEDGDTLLQAPTLLGQLRTQPLYEVVLSWTRYRRASGKWPWMGLEWRRRLSQLAHGAEPSRTPWLAAPWLVAPSEGHRPRARHRTRSLTARALSSPQWDALYEALEPATTRASVLFTLPLTDPRLLEFVFAIPPVPWCQEKQLFRRAMHGQLPHEVLTRPKTALDGAIEARVAQWRAAGGGETPISQRVAPWVDVPAVRDVLRTGTPYEVYDAWRVLQVDAWLLREERRRGA
ncbi:MAG: asparagine synthase-related protein [Gemmatimonadaceae bacterium]|nr:asparagine synthase-related protein [Gemmatimonadaceae bacterium]